MSIPRWLLLSTIITLIAVFLQSTVLRVMFPAYLIPNFVLIFIVYLAFYEVTALGACIAFLVGLIVDVHSSVLLGPWAAASVMVFGVLAIVSDRIFVESYVAGFVVVFFSTIAASLVCLALAHEFHAGALQIILITLSEGVVSGLVAPFLLRALRKLLHARELRSPGSSAASQLR